MTDSLIIAAGVLVAILYGPLVLRLSLLFICIAWDFITDTRAGVGFYDSIYGPPGTDGEDA